MSAKTSFKDLPVWQNSMRLVMESYQLSAKLSDADRSGIGHDLQISATTIPTVIASGSRRGRSGFYDSCLRAREITAEVETLLLLIHNLYPDLPIDDLLAQVREIDTTLLSMAERLAQAQVHARKVV